MVFYFAQNPTVTGLLNDFLFRLFSAQRGVTTPFHPKPRKNAVNLLTPIEGGASLKRKPLKD